MLPLKNSEEDDDDIGMALAGWLYILPIENIEIKKQGAFFLGGGGRANTE